MTKPILKSDMSAPRLAFVGQLRANSEQPPNDLAMSALGQKQTFAVHKPMSAKCQ
jgi:hypothetical protein